MPVRKTQVKPVFRILAPYRASVRQTAAASWRSTPSASARSTTTCRAPARLRWRACSAPSRWRKHRCVISELSFSGRAWQVSGSPTRFGMRWRATASTARRRFAEPGRWIARAYSPTTCPTCEISTHPTPGLGGGRVAARWWWCRARRGRRPRSADDAGRYFHRARRVHGGHRLGDGRARARRSNVLPARSCPESGPTTAAVKTSWRSCMEVHHCWSRRLMVVAAVRRGPSHRARSDAARRTGPGRRFDRHLRHLRHLREEVQRQLRHSSAGWLPLAGMPRGLRLAASPR